MTPPGTFERVYSALKEKLRRGAFRPGERLEPAALADELFASVTPIRDALHRLAGEHLVDTPREGGFRVPSLSESRLRHLYAWHRDLVMLAILRRGPANGSDLGSSTGADLRQKRQFLFSTLAGSTDNPELALALESACDRLQPLEPIEDSLLDDVETESEGIVEALNAGDTRLLRKRLLRYHRRRERIVPRLLDLIQRR